MERARVLDREADGKMEVRDDCHPYVRELPEEFVDQEIRDCEDVDKFIASEKAAEKSGSNLFDESEVCSETEEESQSEEGSGVDPARSDLEMYDYFVILTSGTGKTHKPGVSEGSSIHPKCGRVSKNFTRLELDEKWGEKYELCMKCFGKPQGCHKMCDYIEEKSNGKKRCGRRCNLSCEGNEGVVNCSVHACLFHAEDPAKEDS